MTASPLVSRRFPLTVTFSSHSFMTDVNRTHKQGAEIGTHMAAVVATGDYWQLYTAVELIYRDS